jgi:hypothetical protein
MAKRWSYAVTFESPETRPPHTIRGEVVAGSAPTASSRAIREARSKIPGIRFASLVLLLEKIDAPKG